MRKIVTAVFVFALLASAAVSASAYDWTIGGQLGYGNAKLDDSVDSDKDTSYSIGPEFAKIIDEDTNVGIGLSYEYAKSEIQYTPITELGTSKTFGVYLFGERAVLNPGPLKVFLRADIGYANTKYDGDDEKENTFNVGILPNVQYALSDRLTLIVSSDVLRLGFVYSKHGDDKFTAFGFNAGDGAVTSVGLKYAF